MSNDRFYVAAVSSTDARQAASQWLTTGLTRVAEASLSITGCRLVYLPFAQFHSQYEVPWQADVGQVDRGAYSQAMNIFKMAENDFLSIPENRRLYVLMPMPPKERDFTHWQRWQDMAHGTWLSPLHMSASSAAHGLDERIEQWANKLLDQIPLPSSFQTSYADWSKRGGSARTFLTPPSDEVIISRFSEQMEKAIKKSVEKAVRQYRYIENIACQPTHNCDFTERLILPVYLVDYVVDDGKRGTCLVDGLLATTVIGAKVRDFKAMFGRLFSGFKSPAKAPLAANTKGTFRRLWTTMWSDQAENRG